MNWNIKHLSDSDLSWPDRGNPSFHVPVGKYGRKVAVHPAPMYRHDTARVEALLERCDENFPINDSVPKVLATFDREFESGFNGYAFEDWDYEAGTQPFKTVDGRTTTRYPLALGIALSGKQVPQHPAWTNYLVSHEYGHCAWYASRYFRGYDNEVNGEAHYMAMRGLPDWKDGKRWHERAAEIIANDFRVAFMYMEEDHWPHDVLHPGAVPAVREWWEQSAELCRKGVIPT